VTANSVVGSDDCGELLHDSIIFASRVLMDFAGITSSILNAQVHRVFWSTFKLSPPYSPSGERLGHRHGGDGLPGNRRAVLYYITAL
jgi:hypothetical protein